MLLIVVKDKIKEDVGWYGRANFAGKLFDSVVRIVSQVFQWLIRLCKLP